LKPWAVLGAVVLAGTFAKAAPPIAIDPEVVDLGPVTTRLARPFSFKLVNRDVKPVLIVNVEPDCGCTTYGDDHRSFWIPPGKSVDVPFVYDTRGFYGEFEKSVRFSTRDGAVIKGRFVGVGVPSVAISKGLLDFDAVDRTSLMTQEVEVIYTDPEHIPDDASFVSNASWISAKWRNNHSWGAARGILQVVVDPSGFSPDVTEMRGEILFMTGSLDKPVIRIQVLWSVPEIFRFEPSRPVGYAQADVMEPLRFQICGSEFFRIQSIHADSAEFESRVVGDVLADLPTKCHLVEFVPRSRLGIGRRYVGFRVKTDSLLIPVLKGNFFYVVNP